MLATLIGALESHMFKEVGSPASLVGFRPGTSIYPDTDGGSFSMRMRLCCHGETIRERCKLGYGAVCDRRK